MPVYVDRAGEALIVASLTTRLVSVCQTAPATETLTSRLKSACVEASGPVATVPKVSFEVENEDSVPFERNVQAWQSRFTRQAPLLSLRSDITSPPRPLWPRRFMNLQFSPSTLMGIAWVLNYESFGSSTTSSSKSLW